MANNAFDRTNIGLRERPVSADLNRAYSQADRSLREVVKHLMSARSLSSVAGVPYTGFIGDGFRVVPTSPIGMSVQLTAGLGFFYDTTSTPVDLGAVDLEGVDDRCVYKPMLLTAPQSFAVPAAPSTGNSRIDIIQARYDRRLEDIQLRRQLNVGSKAFEDHQFFKTLSFALDGLVGTVNNPDPATEPLSYTIGAVAATGSEIEPSLTPGYIKIARINVGPNVTTIDSDVLVDHRPLLHPGGRLPFSGMWRVQWNGGAPIQTVLTCDAPPGITVGLAPLATRGSGDLWVAGGRILHGAVAMTAGHQSGLNLADRFAIGIPQTVGTGVPVLTVTVAGGVKAALAAASPAIIVGEGQQVLRSQIVSRFVSSTGTSNNTDASLEDAIIHAVGTVSYA